MKIGPNTQLAPGTKISVKEQRGEVISCKISKDQFGNEICVHLVKMTERYSHSFLGKAIWKPIKNPVIKPCNYSFIYTL